MAALPGELDSLVGELSKLKSTLGYDEDQQDQFALIEQRMKELVEENEEYRAYAEEAIVQAQSLKQEYDELQLEHEAVLAEVNQLKMADMVAKTEELTQAVYEYDRDMVESCVAEAEDFRQEVEELRNRVQELEEENTGLSQTLAEVRQNQQQLQELQRSVEAGLLGTPAAKSEVDSLAAETSFKSAEGTPIAQSPEILPRGVATDQSEVSDKSTMQKTPVQLSFNIVSPPPAALSSQNNSTKSSPRQSVVLPTGAASEDPVVIADALSAVVGGAEVGVVATAAKMLREYAKIDSKLQAEAKEKQRLEQEVDQLHETMTAKTFRAPSAWAEREVKYKQDKRRWEEAQKEFDVKLVALQQEVENLRAGAKTAALEGRIQDLEEQVLQSQQERNSARAALHELQLSLRKEGEFGNAGVKTMSIHDTVERLESISQGSSASHSFNGADKAPPSPPFSKSRAVGFSTPDSRAREASPSTMRQTEEVERRLSQVESDRAALEAELADISSKPPNAANGKVDWEAKTMETEVDLLKKGVNPDAAAELARLKIQLFQLTSEKEAMKAQLQTVPSLTLHINVAENGNAVLPEDDETASPEGVDEDVEEEKAEITAQIQEILAAENLTAVALGLPLPDDDDIEEAAAAPVPVLPVKQDLVPAAVERIHALETSLKAKEEQKGPSLATSAAAAVPQQATSDISFESKGTPAIEPSPLSAIKLNIAVAEGPDGRDERIKTLETLLADKKAEEDKLRKELMEISPVRLSLNLASSPRPGLTSSRASAGSLAGVSMETLAADKAEADLAWAEHRKATDGPALLRAKAELEAKCAVLEGQIATLTSALETSEHDKDVMEQQIATAMSTGDVAQLSNWRERLASKTLGALTPKRQLKLFKKKGVPTKQAMATALHGTQDALHETEAERNALRRQVQRMSEKIKHQEAQLSPSKAPSSPKLNPNDFDMDGELPAFGFAGSTGASDDQEIELHALREENMNLMDQLVATKVKFAETHGDYLEARRSLIRARERQLELQHQLQQSQAVAAQVNSHLRPLQSSMVTSPKKSPRGTSEIEELS